MGSEVGGVTDKALPVNATAGGKGAWVVNLQLPNEGSTVGGNFEVVYTCMQEATSLSFTSRTILAVMGGFMAGMVIPVTMYLYSLYSKQAELDMPSDSSKEDRTKFML